MFKQKEIHKTALKTSKNEVFVAKLCHLTVWSNIVLIIRLISSVKWLAFLNHKKSPIDYSHFCHRTLTTISTRCYNYSWVWSRGIRLTLIFCYHRDTLGLLLSHRILQCHSPWLLFWLLRLHFPSHSTKIQGDLLPESFGSQTRGVLESKGVKEGLNRTEGGEKQESATSIKGLLWHNGNRLSWEMKNEQARQRLQKDLIGYICLRKNTLFWRHLRIVIDIEMANDLWYIEYGDLCFKMLSNLVFHCSNISYIWRYITSGNFSWKEISPVFKY